MSQKGNVLFLILIAVALFAALSYAVSSSMRSGSQSGQKEDIELRVSAVLQQVAKVDQAIERMRVINNCSDTEISFQPPMTVNGYGTTSDYVNPNAPASLRCNAFRQAGADLLLEQISFGNGIAGYLGYSGSVSVLNVGTAAPELIAGVWKGAGALNDFCYALFKKQGLSITTSQWEGLAGSTLFVGSYGATTGVIGDDIPGMAGLRDGCWSNGSGDTWGGYYHVIIPR